MGIINEPKTKHMKCPNCGVSFSEIPIYFSGAYYNPVSKTVELANWNKICCNYCSLEFEFRGGWLCPKKPFTFSTESIKNRRWKE